MSPWALIKTRCAEADPLGTEKPSLGPKLPLPVCFRNGIPELSVSKGKLVLAGERGGLSRQAVQRGTRAGSEAGGVKQLVTRDISARPPRSSVVRSHLKAPEPRLSPERKGSRGAGTYLNLKPGRAAASSQTPGLRPERAEEAPGAPDSRELPALRPRVPERPRIARRLPLAHIARVSWNPGGNTGSGPE